MSGCRKQKKKYKFSQPLRRRDMMTRMLVDIGIIYADTLGADKTSLFLRVKNVPETVIQRVLKVEIN